MSHVDNARDLAVTALARYLYLASRPTDGPHWKRRDDPLHSYEIKCRCQPKRTKRTPDSRPNVPRDGNEIIDRP